jgi:hypothetical protein
VHLLSRYVGVMASLALGLILGGCGSGAVDAKPSTPPAPRGADPIAWMGVFCGGFGDVVAGNAELAKAQPSTPQKQKDALLKLADTTQQAFTNTASKLAQLGQPAVTNGKETQDSAISFFTTTAAAVGGQRAKLAAIDANDPNFEQKANQLASSANGNTTASQLQKATSNGELMAAFGKTPECQQLLTTATH